MSEYGANFNYKDILQQTALYYLARDGNTEAVRLFIQAGV